MPFYDENVYAAMGLCSVRGIGANMFAQLCKTFGSAQRTLNADFETLAQAFGNDMAQKIANCRQNDAIDKKLESCEKLGIDILVYGAQNYPARLLEIYSPPPLLFVRGTIETQDDRAVAVVGTRRPTHYGIRACETICAELAASGITIISGLASGIDGEAHRAALSAGGRTIAILGSAIDNIYPADHKRLAANIIEHGAIISEYAPGTATHPSNFPHRNRIISALSLGVLVVEAGFKSGALITTQHAAEQGREVFAVPGTLFAESSAGTNKLIKDGAKCITTAQDILDALSIPTLTIPQVNEAATKVKTLTGVAKTLFDTLTNEPMHIDTLVREAHVDLPAALTALLVLEFEGIVRQLPGKLFLRNL